MQRIIGEDGTPELIKINESIEDNGVKTIRNNLSVGRYDVVMDTGPGYETKREEGADNLISLLAIGPLAELIAKTGPDLVFRSIDHPYMQELADRLTAQNPEGLKKIMASLSGRARSLVQSLSNENSQLKQALQQAQLEAKYGIAKAHLAATVKAHDVEESNKTKREDTISRDDTKIKTTAMQVHGKLLDTEIKAGAELLNTHTEAKYHREEAERVIEAGESAEK